MIVAELPGGELRRQLRHRGLRIRVGPIVTEVRSRFYAVESAIALHYAAHELVAATDFADFHVAVEAPLGIRRFIGPQALFRFEGNPPFKPLAATQAFPLFEWGLNWCVSEHCHQYLIIHAAVVERSGRAMILPAPPGSGKSTLCAGLVARGWRLLSDELTLIDIDRRSVVPFPRPISLKNASIATMTRFWPDAAMSPVVHDTLKGSVGHVRPPVESVRRAAEPARPGWIVLPRFEAGHATELVTMSRPAAFMQLVENAFNYSMHGRAGFDALTDVVTASDCFQFTYGGDLHAAAQAFDEVAGTR